MLSKKLIINALLAGFWAAAAALTIAPKIDRAAVFAAAAIALRVSVGLISDALGKPVPVDK